MKKKTSTQIKVSKAAYGVRRYRNYVIIDLLTFVNQRTKEASSLTCAHDKRYLRFPDDKEVQLQRGKLLNKLMALSINP